MARDEYPRDPRWTRDVEPGPRRSEPRPEADFGQADYSGEYGYDPERRAGYRAEDVRVARTNDYGPINRSSDYAYDPVRGEAYRRVPADERGDVHDGDRRSWMDRAGAFFSGAPRRDDDGRPARRRGPSDRVLWAVIVERLEDERRLDLRDVEVIVENAEVTLNGTVRRKEDKRRIEDVADIEGVVHVQNNLRVRERGMF